jgi:undecaprenyl pyrophosphate phosphatase UppP
LIQRYFGITGEPLEFFDEFLHIPTIFVLVLRFRKEWWLLLKRLSLTYKIVFKLFCYVFVTNCITLIGWGVKKLFLKQQVWLVSPYALLIGFLVTAGFLFWLLVCDFAVSFRKNKGMFFKSLNIKKVLVLGCVQACSILPGISRFAVTYATARLLKIRPRRAFEFVFLMQCALLVPAAIGGMCDVVLNHMLYRFLHWQVLGVVVVAVVLAYVGLWCMQQLAYRYKLGWMFLYMIVPIIILFCFYFCI